MKAVLILTLFVSNLVFALRLRDSAAIPVIVFGGMGSSCSHPDYTLLVDEQKKGLSTHVECYQTNVTGSINSQAKTACSMLQQNSHFNSVAEINVVGQS